MSVPPAPTSPLTWAQSQSSSGGRAVQGGSDSTQGPRSPGPACPPRRWGLPVTTPPLPPFPDAPDARPNRSARRWHSRVETSAPDLPSSPNSLPLPVAFCGRRLLLCRRVAHPGTLGMSVQHTHTHTYAHAHAVHKVPRRASPESPRGVTSRGAQRREEVAGSLSLPVPHARPCPGRQGRWAPCHG